MLTSTSILLATSLSFLGLPVVDPPVADEDDDAPVTVVTASRAERPLAEAPQSVSVVDRTELERRSYRTVPQALRNTPGVLVQETSHGQGSPFIRGFTSFRTLLLVDGVRLNNSVFREGPNQYWATVDAFSIDRMELLRGPSSALYGSDAIGGTLQVFTRDPWAADGTAAARLFYRVHSSENSHIGRAEASAVEGPLGVTLGATVKEFGDVHGGADIGDQPNTAYEEWDVDGKVERWFGDSRFVLGFQKVVQNDVPRTHSTVFAKSFEGTSVGSNLQRDLDQERNLLYAQLHGAVDGNWADEYSVGLSWQRQEEAQDRIRGNGNRTISGFDVDSFGTFARFEKETSIGTLSYGFDYYRDEVDSFSTGNAIQGPVGDDASYDLGGIYVQDEFAANDWLDMTVGLRAEYAAADANQVDDPENPGFAIGIEDDWTSIVGSVRFTADNDGEERWQTFGGVSQGFRAPNLSDLTRFDSARSGEIEVPSPGLEEERFITFELGERLNGERSRGELAVYYTDIQDQIQRFPRGDQIAGEDVIVKDNVGDGYVMGVELGAEHELTDAFTLFGTASWQDGEIENFNDGLVLVEDSISRLMPLTAHVGLRWEDPGSSLWAEFIASGATDADELSERDAADTERIPPGGTPGYLVLHARGGMSLGERTEVTLGLENLTDEDYRFHGSGSNQPGFGVLLAVSHTF